MRGVNTGASVARGGGKSLTQRRLAWLIVGALMASTASLGGASADHDGAQVEEICSEDVRDQLNPPDAVREVGLCVDNELAAPGAHVEIEAIEIFVDGCTAKLAFCDLQIQVSADHWAHRPKSVGELEVRTISPLGINSGSDTCRTPEGTWNAWCDSGVWMDAVAPISPFEITRVRHDRPPLEVDARPGPFCVQIFAKTTPAGTEGENDERDEDPARDWAGTCISVEGHGFNGLP